MNTGELYDLRRRAVKLWKHKSVFRGLGACPVSEQQRREDEEAAARVRVVTIHARPTNSETGRKSRFFTLAGELCSVEALALEYYAQPKNGGWKGMHCESTLFATLFGLLMWDCIWADVPDVFQHPCQVGGGNRNRFCAVST